MIGLRRAGADDADFLIDMLVAAASWAPGRDLTRAAVLADDHTARYVAGWPRAGDLGLVAELAGDLVGAAWLRRFPLTDPGYGYVAADVPELSIGVVDPIRGQGVGTALLRGLLAEAAMAGVARVSLSVERANPAVRLYRREGFEVVHEGPDALTMLRTS